MLGYSLQPGLMSTEWLVDLQTIDCLVKKSFLNILIYLSISYFYDLKWYYDGSVSYSLGVKSLNSYIEKWHLNLILNQQTWNSIVQKCRKDACFMKRNVTLAIRKLTIKTRFSDFTGKCENFPFKLLWLHPPSKQPLNLVHILEKYSNDSCVVALEVFSLREPITNWKVFVIDPVYGKLQQMASQAMAI